MKWLLKPLEKMLSSCFTQPVTLCSALANSASFPIHPPVEPYEQEKQKSKIFLSLYSVPLVLEGHNFLENDSLYRLYGILLIQMSYP